LSVEVLSAVEPSLRVAAIGFGYRRGEEMAAVFDPWLVKPESY
jgi:hypothetical protein